MRVSLFPAFVCPLSAQVRLDGWVVIVLVEGWKGIALVDL